MIWIRSLSTMLFLLLLSLISSVLCQSSSDALGWEQLFHTLSYKLVSKPPPRQDSAMAHDREKNRLVVFGGWQPNNENSQIFATPVLFDDTWEFNLFTRIWRPLTTSLIRPSARYGMLYSHNKYGLYVFGGKGYFENYFNDLWVFDFTEDMWHKMDQTFVSLVPEARFGPIGGIYSGYEYIGDYKSNLYLAHGRSEHFTYDNMFAYSSTDLRGLNGIWTKVYNDYLAGPFGIGYPHARTFASSAMLTNDDMLVFGGCLSGGFTGGPCPSSDSWLYSAVRNRWEQVDSSCISPRYRSAMAALVTDGFRQSAVLFSGIEKDKSILVNDFEKEDEVALFDSVQRKWIKKKVQSSFFPEKRDGHVMCTGRLNNDYGVFLFGGFGHQSASNLADVWFLRVNISTVFDNPLLLNAYAAPAEIKCSMYFSTIHLHAILMILGWCVFINIGNFVSRYYQAKSEHRRKIIERFYQVLQVLGLLFVSAGLVFGFWSAHGVPHLAHMFIGLAAYVLALLQPVSSCLRKHTRKIDYYVDVVEKAKAAEYESSMFYIFFETIHHNLGRVAICLAIINISMGVFYAVLDWYWIAAWFVFLGANVLFYILFEARSCFSEPNSKKSPHHHHNFDFDDSFDWSSRTGSTQQLRKTILSSSNSSVSHNRDKIPMDVFKKTAEPPLPPPPYHKGGGNHLSSSSLFSTRNNSQSALLSYAPSSNQICNDDPRARASDKNKQHPSVYYQHSRQLSSSSAVSDGVFISEFENPNFFSSNSQIHASKRQRGKLQY